jgi:hypothetical protein
LTEDRGIYTYQRLSLSLTISATEMGEALKEDLLKWRRRIRGF